MLVPRTNNPSNNSKPTQPSNQPSDPHSRHHHHPAAYHPDSTLPAAAGRPADSHLADTACPAAVHTPAADTADRTVPAAVHTGLEEGRNLAVVRTGWECRRNLSSRAVRENRCCSRVGGDRRDRRLCGQGVGRWDTRGVRLGGRPTSCQYMR